MGDSQGREEHMAAIGVEEAVGGNLEAARWSFYLIENCESFLSRPGGGREGNISPATNVTSNQVIRSCLFFFLYYSELRYNTDDTKRHVTHTTPNHREKGELGPYFQPTTTISKQQNNETGSVLLSVL